MAIGLPFSPAQTAAGTAGRTVKVTANNTPTSVAGSLVCSAALRASTIRIHNIGTVLAFARVTGEAIPVATAADIPIAAGTSIVIANPVAEGTAGLAAISSTTTSCDVYFTPGESGI